MPRTSLGVVMFGDLAPGSRPSLQPSSSELNRVSPIQATPTVAGHMEMSPTICKLLRDKAPGVFSKRFSKVRQLALKDKDPNKAIAPASSSAKANVKKDPEVNKNDLTSQINALKMKDDGLVDLNAQLEALKLENEDLKKQEQTWKLDKNILEHKLKNQAEDFKGDIAAVKAEKDALFQANRQQDRVLAFIENENNTQRLDVADLTTERDELENHVQFLQGTNIEMRTRAQCAENLYTSLSAANYEMNIDISYLEAQVGKLQTELQEKKDFITFLNRTVTQYAFNYGALEKSELSQQNQELSKVRDEIIMENNALQEQNLRIQYDLKIQQKESTQLRDEVAKLQQWLYNSEAENHQLKLEFQVLGL